MASLRNVIISDGTAESLEECPFFQTLRKVLGISTPWGPLRALSSLTSVVSHR